MELLELFKTFIEVNKDNQAFHSMGLITWGMVNSYKIDKMSTSDLRELVWKMYFDKGFVTDRKSLKYILKRIDKYFDQAKKEHEELVKQNEELTKQVEILSKLRM